MHLFFLTPFSYRFFPMHFLTTETLLTLLLQILALRIGHVVYLPRISKNLNKNVSNINPAYFGVAYSYATCMGFLHG